MINRNILLKALRKMPAYRDGMKLYSRGSNLNVLLNTNRYNTSSIYIGTCLADMEELKGADYEKVFIKGRKERTTKRPI